VPLYHFQLGDPVTLPIGGSNSPVSALFGCTADGSVFLQVATLPGDGSTNADLALYQVRSPTDVVRFDPRQALSYSAISPITRYFPGESEVIGLAEGKPVDHGVESASSSKALVEVLLTFDRKGALRSASPVDPQMRPEQIAAFDSGDLLLIGWDELRRTTALEVTDSAGIPKRQIHLADNDPAEKSNVAESLITLRVYPYGKNLLLMPQDTRRPILEINEFGVVHTYRLHIPKGYERGLPVSLDRRQWNFRMLAEQSGTESAPESQTPSTSPASSIGLGALQTKQGAILSFDPDDGNVLRQVVLPANGFQPACETNGEFTFLGARAGDGKLQLARGVIVP